MPGAAARAPGTSARGASSSPADQLPPPSVVVASGEKASAWLGRNAATTDPPPSGAATRPPLLATPGGVTSRHAWVPAGRVNSCQKSLCWAAGPPITATAQVPPGAATDVASDGRMAGWEGEPAA
jgi:hypothetical protein